MNFTPEHAQNRFLWKAVAAAGLLSLMAAQSAHSGSLTAQAAGCANAIVCENQLPGTDISTWDISGSGDSSIQGFGTDISVNAGQTINFKIKTTSTNYHLDIYRMGYYQGMGARLVTTVSPSASLPQNQPGCLTDGPTGLVDCGNWAVSASWSVPSTAVSGIYFAKLIDVPSGAASHIVFVVRSDSSSSEILFRTDDTTWQAYNAWGGNSLYTGSAPSSDGRAYKVSYNRPFATRGQAGGFGTTNWPFYAEYPMIRWLESNGYNVSYTSAIDSERSPALLKNHKVFMTAGHDEYWSAGMRSAVAAARDAGVNMAFFTGNEAFWKIRWENAIDGSGVPYRTLVCYKETKAGTAIDPNDPPTWTGTWRDPTLSPPADGGKPENALGGTIFMVNAGNSQSLQVPYAYSKLRLWRNTPNVATLSPGQTATLAFQSVGSEWDEDLDNGARPAGLVRLSSTTASVSGLLLDYGNTYGAGTATHSLTLYKAASGALVFSAGTIQWAWGLDTNHDTGLDVGSTTPDPDMQQATVNLLADMHVQAATLQPGLVAASASADNIAPASTITSPSGGSSVTAGTPVTITGTAADPNSPVAGVEVSTDSGATWHPATGTTNWSYIWTPGAPATVSIKSRATDDSANTETPAAGNSVTIQPRSCPCSLFASSATPLTPSSGDAQAIEVGVKFKADQDGSLNGIRFYKGSGNVGTHTGSLWTNTGTLLATATFTNETSGGWQQVLFASPVAVTANTMYVASYHTDTGNYSVDAAGFNSSVDSWPLHAPASGTAGGNGVYNYGASSFPSKTFNANNYWVDVVYDTTVSSGGPPAVTTVAPLANATGVPTTTVVTARFNKPVVSSSISFTLVDSGNTAVPAAMTYDSATSTASLKPNSALAQGTKFTATVSGARDSSGNVMTAPYSWSFTTMSCPCTLWPSTAVPANTTAGDHGSVELGTKFTSDASGYINGVRFYKGSGNTGTHVGKLWTATGTLLAATTFSGETASGWQQSPFATPVAVSANTTYVVSYHASNGGYSYNQNYFASAYDAPPLHGPSSAASGGNGVYLYGASGFPTQSYGATNYWVDAVFNTSLQDTTPPAVTSMTPADGAANVVFTTSVTATFNKSVVGSSVAFTLKDGGSNSVPAAVTYDDSSFKATLTPGATLAQNTTYTATVSGARDQAGNSMTSAASWSFTTVPCPCSIWSSTTTPATVSVNDPNAIELGVKLRSDVAGSITGVRFYKGSTNTGSHTGSLWTSSGTLLATGTFTGESASGWQTLTFATPVKITANTTYVASYHTNSGNYSANSTYFGSSADSWPLHGLKDGIDGGNGVYKYGAGGFPNQTYRSTNYWVDVVYTT